MRISDWSSDVVLFRSLGRDRRARPGLPVLPGIAEIGNDRRDAAGRSAAQRVDRNQQLHQVVVRRIAGRLDDEDVLAAHVLENLDEHLNVGEAADRGMRQRYVRSEEHTSDLQSLMRNSYAVFCLKKQKYNKHSIIQTTQSRIR